MGIMTVRGTDEMIEDIQSNERMSEEDALKILNDKETFDNSLAGHISHIYAQNKDARRDSGIEQEMLDSMDAFNGEYSKADLSAIEEDNGSKIFMNLTATKCRACASWIKDIIMPAKEKAWRITPSADPEINPEIMAQIEQILKEEFTNLESSQSEPLEGSPPPGPDNQAQAGVPQAPGQPQAKRVGTISKKLREMNKARRDIEEIFRKEVDLIALAEMKRLERLIEDQLHKGNWNVALSEFVEDFTIYPSAFLKGPIINIKPALTYEDGVPTKTSTIAFMNKRISPLDMYPSANATKINEGTLIEHIRFERSEIAALKGLDGYNDDKIVEVLENYQGADFVHWLWTDIEADKAYAEKRGSDFQANKNIIHGLHFFGRASVQMLTDWGLPEEELLDDNGIPFGMTDELEVEALMVDSSVIKVVINDDPLCRRPYYKASFQSRPGSFWGRSLPHLMRDIQRMCNATARALANNMGLSSGPQVEIYTDRLADKGDIEDIKPMKIWQLTSDPTGAGGRAIQFTQPSSNAAELLAVYKEFELRADDATGIPRYAYGNERTGGAAQTASGLSMLLESASKGIKDAIRHIDEGLIKPRIAYQFYWLMKTDKNLKYSGDIEVIPIGSSALTMKAAEQGKRLELMQALSGNPAVLEVVGPEAMATIFRVLFEDANMPEIIIPSGLEIREKVREKEEQAQSAGKAQAEAQKARTEAGLKATELQINGQIQMHQGTLKLKERELNIKEAAEGSKAFSKSQELDSRERQTAQRALADAEKAKADRDFNDLSDRRNLAFELADSQDERKSPTDIRKL